jgi:hypothetical protein
MRRLALLFALTIASPAIAADTLGTQHAQNVDTTTGSTALGALNAACSIAMAGQAGAGFQLAAGTLVGTIVPEVSLDGGTTWVASFFDDPATGNKGSSVVFGSSNTAQTKTLVMAGGTTNARVRVSAFTSGTANCFLKATTAADPSLLSTGSDNSAVPPVGVVGAAIAEADGAAPGAPTAGNIALARADKQGRLLVRASHPFFFSCLQTGITATTSCQAAPGASLSLYVTDVLIANGSTTASTLSLATGTGTNCATGIANVTLPQSMPTNAGAGSWMAFNFQTPVKVTANQAVCCRTAGSTAFGCQVSGYTAP